MDGFERVPGETPADLWMLYPIFKKEVYERRDEMLRIARFGSLVLLLVLALVYLLPRPRLKPSAKLTLSGGVGLFSLTMMYQIQVHRHRHDEAKRQLIQLERALGLFKESEEESSTYPRRWSEPTPDRIGPLLFGSLLMLTLLCWTALLSS